MKWVPNIKQKSRISSLPLLLFLFLIDFTYSQTVKTLSESSHGLTDSVGTSAQLGNCPTGTYSAPGAGKCLQSKRGICSKLTNAGGSQLLSTSSWWYNWGAAPAVLNSTAIEQEFVPMMWSKYGMDGLDDTIIRLKNAGFKIKYLLGFNEPNVKEQSNLSPLDAAKNWPQLVQVARKHGLLIGSPSAAPGQPINAIDWMQLWIKNHTELYNKPPEFDFVTTHYYGCNVNWLKGLMNSYRDNFKKPIWLTEFACPKGNVEQQISFMKESLQYLDGNPAVERYAWFTLNTYNSNFLGPNASLLSEDGQQLSRLGQVYQTYYPISIENLGASSWEIPTLLKALCILLTLFY